MNPTDPSVSPGIGGFLAFFLLACALWLLMRSMIHRMRNVDRHHRLEDETEDTTTDAVPPAMSTRPTAASAKVPGAGRSPDGPDGSSATRPAGADESRAREQEAAAGETRG